MHRTLLRIARCALSLALRSRRNRRNVRHRRPGSTRARRTVALACPVHPKTRIARRQQTTSVRARRSRNERLVRYSGEIRNGSTARLLLANHEEESPTVYTDGFRAYDSLDDDERFAHEVVVHDDDEYVDGPVHVNTCESYGSQLRSVARLSGVSRRINSPVSKSVPTTTPTLPETRMRSSQIRYRERTLTDQQRASEERSVYAG